MMAKIKNFGLNTRFADKLYSNIRILGSTIVHLSGILLLSQPMQSPKNIVLFASGSGSNVENIASFFREDPRVRIKGVLCNNPGAGVVNRCKRLQLPLFCFNRPAFQEQEGQAPAILEPDPVVKVLHNSKDDDPLVPVLCKPVPEQDGRIKEHFAQGNK